MNRRLINILISLVLFCSVGLSAGDFGEGLASYQQKLRLAGDDMLENMEVSYVYGGSKLGDEKICVECNLCLEEKQPAPKERLKVCKACGGCSLDCSHFIQLVFARAGLGFPYLTSLQMADLEKTTLEKKYGLRPIDSVPAQIIPGDLLVYRGHVVMVERIHEQGRGDIIHATGGKDIREPGQGIQRERFVRLASFRGELLRILRHVKLDHLSRKSSDQVRSASAMIQETKENPRFKMRPVEKRNPRQ